MKINHLAIRIKQARLAKFMTQQKVADLIPCSRKTYQNIESGKTNPSINTLKQLAQILEKPLEYLLDES